MRITACLLFLCASLLADDAVRQESRVDAAIAKYNVTGKNVIYAMIDRGIDWQNNDFRNADGTTRIAYIFDLTDDTGANAANNLYGKGTIYTRDQINAALAGGTALPERDALGHGTCNTGLAAGNGRNSAGGKYRGMAPDATIISVKITSEALPAHDGQPASTAFYDATRIPIALNFVRDKARELGMPASVVMDIGSIGGPADGTSSLVRTFDSFVGTAPGLSFIPATGDDGGQPNHASGVVPQDGEISIQVQKAASRTILFDLWYPGADRYDVTVVTPTTTLGPFPAPAAGAADFRQNLTDISYFHYGENTTTGYGPPNGKRLIDMFLSGPTGVYTIKLKGVKATGHSWDANINPSDEWDDSKANAFLTYAQPGKSLSDFGSSYNSVLVSTYVVRSSWTNINGQVTDNSAQGAVGDLWIGQSIGPTYDNRLTFDVASPGETAVCTYDPKSYWATSKSAEIEDGIGLYGAAGANSSANPIVGGIIALMLQANPHLDSLTIKDILRKSARTDQFTGSVPNAKWGYGKVDALAAMDIVKNTPAPSFPANGLVNGASFLNGPVAPGEVFTIFGSNMGPANLVGIQLGNFGAIQASVSGTEVLFDGVPAPTIYTSAGQVAGTVPYSVAGKTTTKVQVQYEGIISDPITVRVADTSPAILMAPGIAPGHVAALNQDNSVNSPARPESRGRTVVLYATGEGQTSPAGVDGRVAATVFPKPVAPVSLKIGGVPVPAANIAYAGAAPGFIAGVLQINVKIPDNAPTGDAVPVILTIGGVDSPRANVSVK